MTNVEKTRATCTMIYYDNGRVAIDFVERIAKLFPFMMDCINDRRSAHLHV